MDRAEFADLMGSSEITLSPESRFNYISKSLDRDSREIKLVVIMEELAELQKEVSKILRGEEDHYALLEEMADVRICMEYLTRMFKISEWELNKAMDIKLKRDSERVVDVNE